MRINGGIHGSRVYRASRVLFHPLGGTLNNVTFTVSRIFARINFPLDKLCGSRLIYTPPRAYTYRAAPLLSANVTRVEPAPPPVPPSLSLFLAHTYPSFRRELFGLCVKPYDVPRAKESNLSDVRLHAAPNVFLPRPGFALATAEPRRVPVGRGV